MACITEIAIGIGIGIEIRTEEREREREHYSFIVTLVILSFASVRLSIVR